MKPARGTATRQYVTPSLWVQDIVQSVRTPTNEMDVMTKTITSVAVVASISLAVPLTPGHKQAPVEQFGQVVAPRHATPPYAADYPAPELLTVASLTAAFEDYDLGSNRDLTVRWTAPAAAESIAVRALGLHPRIPYRMDAVLSAHDNTFRWRLDLLRNMRIGRRHVGVVAWVHQHDRSAPMTFLPLTVMQTDASVNASEYDLVILPGRELREVYVTIALTDSNGRPDSLVWRDKRLEYGYYPARRPITVRLPRLSVAGFYYLEIGATLRHGGAAGMTFLLYHPGERVGL